MAKGSVICIDRYTMKELGRWSSVKEAAKILGASYKSIYNAVCLRRAMYDCYWLYARDLQNWKPSYISHKKVHGILIPEKLQELIKLQKE